MKDKQAKYPQLRFKGFTDPWVQRKVSETAEVNPKTTLPDEFEYVDLGAVVGTSLNETRHEFKVSAPSRAQRLASVGDVFYQTVRPYQKNNYLFENAGITPFVFSTGYAQLRPQGDSYFLLTLLQGENFVSQVMDRSTGTSYPAINSSDLSNMHVDVPTEAEQVKIGSLFKSLDNLIAANQRKLAKLKELKQGYLQKLFPKNGSKFPQLRFAGFADAWEERKLSEIGKIVTGNTPSTSNKGYYNGDFLFASPADIQENRYVNKTTTTLTELGFKTGRLVPKGATLFVSIGSTIGKIGQSICDVITNQQINSVISFSDYDDDFIYTSILNSSTKIKQLAATQAVPIINKNEFGKSIIKIPSLEEQQKIGAFFKQLDDTIALHQRKLDLLKEQKKGFLQKMFV